MLLLLLLLEYRCCTASAILKFRASVGWNRSAPCVQDGTPTYAYTRTQRPSWLSQKIKTRSTAPVVSWLPQRQKYYGVVQVQQQQQQTAQQMEKINPIAPLFLTPHSWFPRLSDTHARTHTLTHTHAHAHTHTRAHAHTQRHRSWLSQRETLEARLLYRGCLVFECGTSETAAEVKT